MFNRLTVLSPEDIEKIHQASLEILRDVGVRLPHPGVLKILSDAGAAVDLHTQVCRIPSDLVTQAIHQAGKQHILYGRERTKTARFGYGDIVTCASAGQYSWIEIPGGNRRNPTQGDFHKSIVLADALENITIVGGMGIPSDIPIPWRDVFMACELVKNSTKPGHCWVAGGTSLRYILEIYEAVQGGSEEHRLHPMMAGFIEPISPLGFAGEGLEILLLCAQKGLPLSFGPMAQAGATAPVTLAGTLTVENAEILAGITLAQVIHPGLPVTFGGIPHVLDMREMLISFGSPEQGLMAVAMTQMAKHYGFPVYINVGLGDGKLPDAQNGMERGMTMLMGALAGGDLLGHMGICGADQGASLEQLIIDNQMIAYIKRIMKSFEVNDTTIPLDLIKSVGIGGNYLAQEHTVRNFRNEIWIPRGFDRRNWEAWIADGAKSIGDWAQVEKERILNSHVPPIMDEALTTEINRIVKTAAKEMENGG
jgi:trimethylamine---corrinoid protein Co-methyltransferase